MKTQIQYAFDEDAAAALSFEIKVLMPYALCLCLMSYACDEDGPYALCLTLIIKVLMSYALCLLCLMPYAFDEDAAAALSFEVKVLMLYALRSLCIMPYAYVLCLMPVMRTRTPRSTLRLRSLISKVPSGRYTVQGLKH